MRSIFLFAVILACAHGKSQNQLKNIFSAWTEVHGGAEDSGISRSESYVFVTSKPVKIKGILYNEKEIELGIHDTLSIHLNFRKVYNANDPKNTDENKKTDTIPLKQRFLVVKKKKHVYHAWVNYPYEWPKSIEYEYKKKTYTANTKKEFDRGNKEYAP